MASCISNDHTWLTHPGNGYTTLDELCTAVRQEASKLAKASRGSLDPPTSSDPPGDWRIFFKMNGEFVRPPRRRSDDGPPGWDNRSATQRHAGTGVLPTLPADELRALRTAATGHTGTADLDQDTVETPDNHTPCIAAVDLTWDFKAEDFFEENSFMESPYGRKLLGQPVAVFVSEQFEPADAGICPTDDALLGPRIVFPEDDDPDAPKGRPRKMTRHKPGGGPLRAVDGWIDGIVTGWHDARDNTVVTLGSQPNHVMQGPAKKDSRGRPASYLVYHAWLGTALWHNLDVQLYSLDPGAKVDHWRAFKSSKVMIAPHASSAVVRHLQRSGIVLPHVVSLPQ